MLGPERVHDQLNLFLENLPADRHKKVRLPQIPIVLGDLIFENQVITKGIPSHLRKNSVVLVGIATVVGKNDIWRNRSLQFLKDGLHFGNSRRKQPIPKSL